LLLSTATPTGRARAVAMFGDSVTVRFLPYDTPGSMRRFLARARPRLAIILETELWPNLYHQCRRRGIPIVLANARLSARSTVWYRRFAAVFRNVLSGETFVAAQSIEDAQRFRSIGAAPERTHVIGNLKFDVLRDPAVAARGAELRATFWNARPVWIAGSTHAGEEEIVLTAHASVQAHIGGALLLLVPRHPERFQSVADLLSRRGLRFERRSSGNVVMPDAQVLLVDTVGELHALYAAADVAFVGGSLVPVGGHNVLEPAALGVPVITGPHQFNAREVAVLMMREGAAVQISDAAGLAAQVEELLTNPERQRQMGESALRVVTLNSGSLGRLLEFIESLLAQSPAARP